MDYSNIAKGYDELYSGEQLKKLKLIKSLLTLKKDQRLLDVGCGTGISTYYFENDCDVIGIDPCKELIEQNPKRLRIGNAENLPFEDNTFNIVISVTAIHNFDDIEKGISEMKRVLKDKGQLIISVMKKSEKLNKIKQLLKDFKSVEEEKDIIFYATPAIN